MWNVLEQPWTLLITAAALALVVAVVLPFIQAKSKRLLWLTPLLVAPLAFALDFAVSTDREKIQNVIDAGVKAVENEDPDAIAAILAPDYQDSSHPDKAALVRHCRAVLQPPLVDHIYSSIRQIRISADAATVTVLNKIFFDPKSDLAEFARLIIIEVQIDLQKTPDRSWLITRTEIQAVNNQPAKWTNVNYPNW